MIDYLLQKRNTILIVLVAVLLVCCALTMILGNGEDKGLMLLLTVVVTPAVYGFGRFLFWMIGKRASLPMMRFFLYFYLLVGLLMTLYMVVLFIAEFPNGLYPSLGAAGAFSVAVLDWEKRRREKER